MTTIRGNQASGAVSPAAVQPARSATPPSDQAGVRDQKINKAHQLLLEQVPGLRDTITEKTLPRALSAKLPRQYGNMLSFNVQPGQTTWRELLDVMVQKHAAKQKDEGPISEKHLDLAVRIATLGQLPKDSSAASARVLADVSMEALLNALDRSDLAKKINASTDLKGYLKDHLKDYPALQKHLEPSLKQALAQDDMPFPLEKVFDPFMKAGQRPGTFALDRDKLIRSGAGDLLLKFINQHVERVASRDAGASTPNGLKKQKATSVTADRSDRSETERPEPKQFAQPIGGDHPIDKHAEPNYTWKEALDETWFGKKPESGSLEADYSIVDKKVGGSTSVAIRVKLGNESFDITLREQGEDQIDALIKSSQAGDEKAEDRLTEIKAVATRMLVTALRGADGKNLTAITVGRPPAHLTTKPPEIANGLKTYDLAEHGLEAGRKYTWYTGSKMDDSCTVTTAYDEMERLQMQLWQLIGDSLLQIKKTGGDATKKESSSSATPEDGATGVRSTSSAPLPDIDVEVQRMSVPTGLNS